MLESILIVGGCIAACSVVYYKMANTELRLQERDTKTAHEINIIKAKAEIMESAFNAAYADIKDLTAEVIYLRDMIAAKKQEAKPEKPQKNKKRVSESEILAFIQKEKLVRKSQIMKATGCSKTNLGLVLKRLEQTGKIEIAEQNNGVKLYAPKGE